MSVVRVVATMQSPGMREAPPEIQLWDVGPNPTDYGVHTWSERSAKEVLARYELRGNPLQLDIDHLGSTTKDGQPVPTAGYARLELRNGAPWLVFDWSDYARGQIASGERRFLSPEYDVDKKTGEILALYRVSLVGDPGTHRARMLAAARKDTPMDPVIIAAIRAALAAEDPAAAVESLLAELEKAAGGGADPAAASNAAPASAEPVVAASDPPADADKDRAEAGAKPAPKPAPPTAYAPSADSMAADAALRAIAAEAAKQVEDASRDHLILTQGDRLDPSIRRWASSQPLAVVKGLLDAAPSKDAPVERVTATRGATQGKSPQPKGLEGKELEELERAMGTFKVAARAPHVTDGVLYLPSTPPSEVRERKRAAAAAGKEGK